MRSNLSVKLLCAAILCMTTAVWADDARKILDASGVKGGLVVHIGCGDGQLTANLARADSYIVQGLGTQRAQVEKAQQNIRKKGIYGKVSATLFNGRSLPYADDLVNLVVASDLGSLSMAEVMRVLCPNGVAYIKKGGKWEKTVKPRPADIDEWTHYLYDSKNNAVSHDAKVGPPNRLQWVGAPQWTRNHDHMSSISAAVSSGGRVFYIVDEGPVSSVQLPPDWKLVARDAFNGTLLWERAIPEWQTAIWPAKSGPAQLPRRLVAIDDKVYVTLGLKSPVSVLDAATGETLKTYKGTELTEELIVSDDLLFVTTNVSPIDRPLFQLDTVRCWTEARRAKSGPDWSWNREIDRKKIVVLEIKTGKVLWQTEDSVAPITLTANEQFVFYHNGEKAVCLDRKTGRRIWKSEHSANLQTVGTHEAPNLVVYGQVVLFSQGPGEVISMSIKDGKTLWTGKHAGTGHQSSYDLMVAGDLVWSTIGSAKSNKNRRSAAPDANKPKWTYVGRDPVTGEEKIEFPPDSDAFWFHHRCHRGRATDKYLLMSRTGIEYIDIATGHWMPNHWIRGACIYGIMPANGLTYAPPHSCACYIESKLTGFNAVTAQPPANKPKEAPRLEKGIAYGKTATRKSRSSAADSWPTFRYDAMRSSATPMAVSADLKQVWRSKPGGKISSPVIANGKVFVAQVDEHTVHAFSASNGRSVWSYTAGGRVDSPPTIYKGLVLFGSADGWVYCLRESDGELAWRYRAVARERNIVSYDQVESAWPVHGSVLVQDGSVYCVAGRSMFLDGGLRFLKLDAVTGTKLTERTFDDKLPGTDESLQSAMKSLDMPVALSDILSSDGKRIYMRSQNFDLNGQRSEIPVSGPTDQGGDQAHLVCPSGFLDSNWHHRSYWVFGNGYGTGHNGWFRAGRYAPAGRILVFDKNTVYGYGRQPEYYVWSTALEYQLFAAQRDMKPESIAFTLAANNKQESAQEHGHEITFDRELMRQYPLKEISAIDFNWRKENPPLMARAMVLAGKTLFVAGPQDVLDEEELFANPFDPEVIARSQEQKAAFNGRRGAILQAVSAGTGQKLSELQLDAPPAFDGMAAAEGRLFISMTDGTIRCFAKKK